MDISEEIDAFLRDYAQLCRYHGMAVVADGEGHSEEVAVIQEHHALQVEDFLSRLRQNEEDSAPVRERLTRAGVIC